MNEDQFEWPQSTYWIKFFMLGWKEGAYKVWIGKPTAVWCGIVIALFSWDITIHRSGITATN